VRFSDGSAPATDQTPPLAPHTSGQTDALPQSCLRDASPAAHVGQERTGEPRLRPVRDALVLAKRMIRAVRLAATDRRIPRPLRWLAGLALAPIPGPFDEALLLAVAVPLALFYREQLADAWTRSGKP
jgi:hypothetical protein